jgi:hypothetical protein
VVGHEAVRNNCELQFERSSRNLRKNERNGGVFAKDWLATIGTERQGISVKTFVVEGSKNGRLSREHAAGGSKGRARVRSG